MRRSPTPVFIVLGLFMGVVAWVFLATVSRPSQPVGSAAVPAAVSEPGDQAPEQAKSAANVVRPAGEKTVPRVLTDMDPARFRRAYMLSLEGETLALEGVEDVEGDFAVPRRQRAEWGGMLRCRLMTQDGKVLSEELISAPDHVCQVLDSRAAGADGLPKPVRYTAPGPVLFQLKLPRLAQARTLQISRVTGPGGPSGDQQMGTITLPTL